MTGSGNPTVREGAEGKGTVPNGRVSATKHDIAPKG